MRRSRLGFTVAGLLGAVLSGLAVSGAQAESEGKDGIGDVLQRPVGIVLEDVHLREIVEFVRDTYDINIIVDNRVMPLAGQAQLAADSSEYVTDGVVAYVNMKNVSLAQALHAILRPLKLDFSIQDSFIWISTPENLRHETFEDLVTRYYELPSRTVPDVNRGIRSEDAEPIDIVTLVRQAVPEILEPESRQPLSFVRFNGEMNQLVVHNTPPNHKRVEQLLNVLFSEE